MKNMRKFIAALSALSLMAAFAVFPVSVGAADTETITYNYNLEDGAYNPTSNHTRQMEKLDRGLVAIKSGNGVYLSWRLFDSEDMIYGSADENVTFNVYRNGTKANSAPVNVTNYTDTTVGTSYQVAPVVDGVEGSKCDAVSVYSNSYFDINLTAHRPTAANLPKLVKDKDNSKVQHFADADGNYIDDWRDEKVAWIDYEYTINDCSTGDLDGDGQYEIVVKWDANGQDNSFSGVTGNVYLDAYKLDGTPLWDAPIDLGKNIRAGAHYTQFLVYDLDGDGKAEISCKTAPGSKDSKGVYVSKASASSEINSISDADNEKDYRNGGGYILDGPEYYTVFSGRTGAAIDTIEYPVPRGRLNLWGDTYGNRVDRYLGGIAYLDGVHPSIIAWRGYYARTTAAGITFEDGRLSVGNIFIAESNKQFSGQGNHNLTVADVDNDGKDEVICGGLALDDDLTPLWCGGRGHGDALHIGDYDPTHKGLEYFTVHESGDYEISGSTNGKDGSAADYGMTVYDAATGEEIVHYANNRDTGRGTMANIGSGGYYQISGAGTYQCNGGSNFTATSLTGGSNFRIFWDGDLFDEILDGTSISNLSDDGTSIKSVFSTGNNYVSINSTKANPCLQADILGDWREEVIYPAKDNKSIRVFMATTLTDYKIKTLMHDPVYRSGVAAEQTAYNQPPHVGFYMADIMFKPVLSRIEISSPPAVVYQGSTLNTSKMTVTAHYADGTSEILNEGDYTLDCDTSETGTATAMVTYGGKSATFKVTVLPASIEAMNGDYITASSTQNDIPIGSYSGKFTIEHKLTINSMPAAGSGDKNSTAGFFTRFLSAANSDGNTGIGGGWYFVPDGTSADVYWKSGASRASDAIKITTSKLETGAEYTFKYEFNDVGTGNGAAVTLTITDSQGNVVGSGAALNLRNLSDSDSHKVLPLVAVQIYNQANANSTASVTISGAKLITNCTIDKVEGQNVTMTFDTLGEMCAYAAKYDAGALTDIEEITPEEFGASTVDAGFEPDKVFIWAKNMEPVALWVKQ